MRVSAHAGWAGRWCGWCACVPLVGRTVVAWLSLVFVSAPLFCQCGGIGRRARLKSGCPVGRASSSLATGTGGTKWLNMGVCARVVADIGRVAPMVGAAAGCVFLWRLVRGFLLRVLRALCVCCFVSPVLDSNPAWLLGPTANRFAHIVWVGFDSSAVR